MNRNSGKITKAILIALLFSVFCVSCDPGTTVKLPDLCTVKLIDEGSAEPAVTYLVTKGSEITIEERVRKDSMFVSVTLGDRVFLPGDTIKVKEDIDLIYHWQDHERCTLTIEYADGSPSKVLEASVGKRVMLGSNEYLAGHQLDAVTVNGLAGRLGDTIFLEGDTVIRYTWKEKLCHLAIYDGARVEGMDVELGYEYDLKARKKEGFRVHSIIDAEGHDVAGDAIYRVMKREASLSWSWEPQVRWSAVTSDGTELGGGYVDIGTELVFSELAEAAPGKKFRRIVEADGSVWMPDEKIVLRKDTVLTFVEDGWYTVSFDEASAIEPVQVRAGDFIDMSVYDNERRTFASAVCSDGTEVGSLFSPKEDTEITVNWTKLLCDVTVETGIFEIIDGKEVERVDVYTLEPSQFFEFNTVTNGNDRAKVMVVNPDGTLEEPQYQFNIRVYDDIRLKYTWTEVYDIRLTSNLGLVSEPVSYDTESILGMESAVRNMGLDYDTRLHVIEYVEVRVPGKEPVIREDPMADFHPTEDCELYCHVRYIIDFIYNDAAGKQLTVKLRDGDTFDLRSLETDTHSVASVTDLYTGKVLDLNTPIVTDRGRTRYELRVEWASVTP